MLDQLKQRLQDRSARIGVIGLGYVGLPLILRLSAQGFPVAGFDINDAHVSGLPMHPDLTEADQDRVIDAMKGVLDL